MKTLRTAAVILGYSFLGENCLTDKQTAYDKRIFRIMRAEYGFFSAASRVRSSV